MADGLELDAERIGPKGGVVVTRVLRKMLGRMDHGATLAEHMVVNSVDERSAPDHEGQVLQAGPFR
jgi:hypothetical protein